MNRPQFPRRGTILIYTMVALATLCGLVSLAVDVGHVQVVKIQLQQAADAAAQYAAIGFSTDANTARLYAQTAASYNLVDGSPVVLDPNYDIEFGSWDANSRTFTVLSGTAQSGADALRVTARRTQATGNAVQLAFGKLIGRQSCDVRAQAIAVSTTYGFGIVGLSSLVTNRSNIDSWNSAVGPYTTFFMNKKGNCASNGNIVLNSGTNIEGNCQPGKGRSVISSGTVSGSTAPLTYTLAFPAPIAGAYATANDNSQLPAPYFNSGTGDFTIPNGTALTIPGGTYYVNNIIWRAATITFTGPTVFYITGSTFFTFNNHVTTYQSLPKNLKFLVTGSCTVTYDFDEACYAVVYAPLADVRTLGMADDYGSIIGNTLTLTTGWHVDESLGGAGYTGSAWLVQ